MDERYFPEPKRFWPERWQTVQGNENEETNATAPKAYKGVNNTKAFLGFGQGQRGCVGKNVGEINSGVLIAQVRTCMQNTTEFGTKEQLTILIYEFFADFTEIPTELC